jgi:hypothetical protein
MEKYAIDEHGYYEFEEHQEKLRDETNAHESGTTCFIDEEFAEAEEKMRTVMDVRKDKYGYFIEDTQGKIRIDMMDGNPYDYGYLLIDNILNGDYYGNELLEVKETVARIKKYCNKYQDEYGFFVHESWR